MDEIRVFDKNVDTSLNGLSTGKSVDFNIRFFPAQTSVRLSVQGSVVTEVYFKC